MDKYSPATIPSVDYLIKFAAREDLTNYRTVAGENEIRPEIDENGQFKNSLGRVFNNRMGFLSVATFTENEILLLNDFLLMNEELQKVTYTLQQRNIKFKVLHFGTDEYQRYTFNSYYDYVNRMKRIQSERNDKNFLQWLFRKQ